MSEVFRVAGGELLNSVVEQRFGETGVIDSSSWKAWRPGLFTNRVHQTAWVIDKSPVRMVAKPPDHVKRIRRSQGPGQDGGTAQQDIQFDENELTERKILSVPIGLQVPCRRGLFRAVAV